MPPELIAINVLTEIAQDTEADASDRAAAAGAILDFVTAQQEQETKRLQVQAIAAGTDE